MALAPQIDPGTPDLPWHPSGPGTSGLALAPQTGPGTPDWPWHLQTGPGPGTPDCEEILRSGRPGKSEALRKLKVDYETPLAMSHQVTGLLEIYEMMKSDTAERERERG